MNRKRIIIPVVIFTAIIIALIIVMNPINKYKKLTVSENKWKNIQESRIENMNLKLEEICFNDYQLIIDEKSNTIYYSIVNDSINKYTPNVSYTTNDTNSKLVILSDEITDEKVKNNYQFKLMIYNEKEYHIYNLKCTDLPILNITYDENDENMQKNIPMEMYLFDNLSNIPNKITISSGKVRINDESTAFSLHILTPGKNKRDNKISILNMKPDSEYVLTTIDNEEEMELDMNKRVELFLNDEYKGVYLLGTNEGKNQKNENMPKT